MVLERYLRLVCRVVFFCLLEPLEPVPGHRIGGDEHAAVAGGVAKG
jgi:hypothetical protein